MSLTMTTKALELALTYDAMIRGGWTDEALIEHGYAHAPQPQATRTEAGVPITYNPPYVGRPMPLAVHRINRTSNGVIVCRVALSHLRKEGNQLLVMTPLITDLKAAGVPIEGALSLCLVTHGKMVIETDDHDAVFVWWPE